MSVPTDPVDAIAKLDTKIRRVFFIRLNDGDDLISVVKAVSQREGVQTGFVTAIGALTKVSFAVYSLEKQRYESIEMEGYFEFTSVVGNISTVVDEQGRPIDLFVHVHVNLSGHDGRVYGGHLQHMSCIALGEVTLYEVEGLATRLRSQLDQRGYSPLRFDPLAAKRTRPASSTRPSEPLCGSRPIIARGDVAGLIIDGTITVDDDAILTPLAREEIARRGLSIVRNSS